MRDRRSRREWYNKDGEMSVIKFYHLGLFISFKFVIMCIVRLVKDLTVRTYKYIFV